MRLVIATETFPFGKGEKPFLIPEISELEKHFEITVCSHATKKDEEDKTNTTILNPNIKVVNLNVDIGAWQRIVYAILYFLDKDARKEMKEILCQKKEIIKRIYQSVSFFALSMENLRLMKKNHLLSENTIYYSFWFYYYTYSMVRYKMKVNNIKVVTRTHGFDLYNERYSGGRQPFKKIMSSYVDKVFFVSSAGETYYKKYFDPEIGNRGMICRLGTQKLETRNILSNEKKVFRLVSCSSVIPLKRVELIVEALATLQSEKIEWIHFGGGEDFASIQKYANVLLNEKENISYKLMGPVENEDVLQFYQKEFVDCFITTSSTEGMPVSIMEAMSVGIPIIGTEVGGIPEMIRNNGVLLSKDPAVRDVANAILYMYYASDGQMNLMRNMSYDIWKSEFCFQDNINLFIEALKDIGE